MISLPNRTEMDLKYFGERMSSFRKKKRLSQWQIASCAHISQTTYSQIEIGNRMPLLSTALSIADALDVELEELIGHKEVKKGNIKDFYAKFKLLEHLNDEQSVLILGVARHIVNGNMGIRYVN